MYAHTRLANQQQMEYEPLQQHLLQVGSAAASFAGSFGAEMWGDLLGRCHDLGKGSREFQDYLKNSSTRDAVDASEEREGSVPERGKRVDHSSFGAKYAARNFGPLQGTLLAYAIAGHHAGLPDWRATDDASGRSTLQWRLSEENRIPASAEPETALPAPAMPIRKPGGDPAFSLAFFTRMLFSALIDADRTCTEAFAEPEQARERQQPRPSLDALSTELDKYVHALQQRSAPTVVNQKRQQVLAQCRAAAAFETGLFSLQVPTGGGKSLASLVFALKHALLHGQRRIIYAIPFTSIIEQTADVYRKALGSHAQWGMVEHHTGIEPNQRSRASQFGSENWDAPLVVTTNVQLFESLFAARTTPCRKLHNISNSVLVLDEAQTLPVELLAPTLAALRELVAQYGCSIVLCTATQPALTRRPDFEIGLDHVRPIIDEPQMLFDALKRVEIGRLGALTDAQLTARLSEEPRSLCIVNTRPHAAELYDLLSSNVEPSTCFHLSTLMCGAHRRKVLRQIRDRLKEGGQACRIVSTQLIEAGVDLDLPVVYRAAAGLDAIAQAAGRCNREGQLAGLGTTYVFETADRLPPGFLAQSRQAGSEILSQFPNADPLGPQMIEAYFRRLYWSKRNEWDKAGVMQLMQLDRQRGQLQFQFRQIAAAYRMIEDKQVPILVPYGKGGKNLASNLLGGHVEYIPQRQLQPFLVSVPERTIFGMERAGVVQQHPSGVWVLLREDVYTEAKGLKLDGFGLDARVWGV